MDPVLPFWAREKVHQTSVECLLSPWAPSVCCMGRPRAEYLWTGCFGASGDLSLHRIGRGTHSADRFVVSGSASLRSGVGRGLSRPTNLHSNGGRQFLCPS